MFTFSIFQKDHKMAIGFFKKMTCGVSGTSDGLLNLGKHKKEDYGDYRYLSKNCWNLPLILNLYDSDSLSEFSQFSENVKSG